MAIDQTFERRRMNGGESKESYTSFERTEMPTCNFNEDMKRR